MFSKTWLAFFYVLRFFDKHLDFFSAFCLSTMWLLDWIKSLVNMVPFVCNYSTRTYPKLQKTVWENSVLLYAKNLLTSEW